MFVSWWRKLVTWVYRNHRLTRRDRKNGCQAKDRLECAHGHQDRVWKSAVQESVELDALLALRER